MSYCPFLVLVCPLFIRLLVPMFVLLLVFIFLDFLCNIVLLARLVIVTSTTSNWFCWEDKVCSVMPPRPSAEFVLNLVVLNVLWLLCCRCLWNSSPLLSPRTKLILVNLNLVQNVLGHCSWFVPVTASWVVCQCTHDRYSYWSPNWSFRVLIVCIWRTCFTSPCWRYSSIGCYTFGDSSVSLNVALTIPFLLRFILRCLSSLVRICFAVPTGRCDNGCTVSWVTLSWMVLSIKFWGPSCAWRIPSQ